MKKHKIHHVVKNSIADSLGISVGDFILAINGQEIEDIFDYQFYVQDGKLSLCIEKENGEEQLHEIVKDEMEDIGIDFDNGLMDEYRSCKNKCIFCFIDQLPKGMRESLYFKDDDSRLSFLQGNYITLTNMSDHDIERIIKYHLSPINISFQTTNPELRCKMLNNRFAGDALEKVDRLYEAGIGLNGQIVLCKGINDGMELERSISDLTKYLPNLESVSVVPVGLAKHREGLYPLEPFTKEDALAVINTIHKWQTKVFAQTGNHFIHASDEWYILAGLDMPKEEQYDGYLQIANGVGMVRSLVDEVRDGLLKMRFSPKRLLHKEVSIVTGLLAYDYMVLLANEIMKVFKHIKIHVYGVRNDFFGEHITVTGLLTGQDMIAQLQGKVLGEKLLLSEYALRSGETVLLDNLTVADIEKALQVRVDIVKSSGYDLIETVLRK